MKHVKIIGPVPPKHLVYDWEAEGDFNDSERTNVINLDTERRNRRIEEQRISSALTILKPVVSLELYDEVQ